MNEGEPSFAGSIPQIYDRDLGPVLFAAFAADMARRVVSCGPPARVLETACGTGIVTRALRDALPLGSLITATDFSQDMLKVAKTRIRPGEQVTFQPVDGTDLPFADASFDAVVCQFGMMFFPDKDRGFQQAHRVLAPGGRYLFSVWDAHRHNPLGRIAHTSIGSFFPDDPPGFYELPHSYHLIDPIKESLLAAGFDGMDVSVVRHRHRMEDFAAFARGLVFGSPMFGQIMERGGVVPDGIEEGVAGAMRRELGTEPTTVALQAIFIEAKKS